MRHFMNPAVGKHMGMETEEGEGKKKREPMGAGKAHKGKHDVPPDIHIKSHKNEHGEISHTMHIMHEDGAAPETHEFEHGDTEGIHEKLKHHLAGGHHM